MIVNSFVCILLYCVCKQRRLPAFLCKLHPWLSRCEPLPNLRPGEELCFEEVRGAAWLQRRQAQAAAAAAQQATRTDDDMELDGDTCVLPSGPPPAMLSCARPARPQASPAAQPAAGEAAAFSSPAAVGEPAAQASPAAAVSPAGAGGELQAPAPSVQPAAEEATVLQPEAAALEHEPAAAEDAAEQQGADVLLPTPFDLPASAEKPDAAEQLADAAEEPAETQSAEAVEAQPSPSPASGMQHEPAGGLAEPTITLSTRDAFAAINQMFGVRLPPGWVVVAGLCVMRSIKSGVAWHRHLLVGLEAALPNKHPCLPAPPAGCDASQRRTCRPACRQRRAGRGCCSRGSHYDDCHQGRVCRAQPDVQGERRWRLEKHLRGGRAAMTVCLGAHPQP